MLRWMTSHLALVPPCLLALFALSCAKPPLPLVEAPGARAVFAGADAKAALELVTRLGVKVPPGTERFVAGVPWAASVLPAGEVIVVLAADAGLVGDGALGDPVLGSVRSVRSEAAAGTTLLVRADRGRLLIAPAVPEPRRAELAALLEVMATAEAGVVVTPPPPGVLRVRFDDALLPLGVVDVRVDPQSDGPLVIRALAPAARDDVVRALTAPAPSWACALDEGALAVLTLPPFAAAGVDDAFTGPMLLAIYPRGDEPPSASDPLPGAALVVAGTPKFAEAGDELARLLPADARETREGPRRTLEAEGVRALRIVSDTDLLAVGFGAGAPVSRIRPQVACPPDPRPLMAGDLAAVARALPGLMPAALGLTGPSPFVARAVREGAGLALEVRARVRPGVPF